MDEETMDEDVGALSAMGDIDLAQIKSDPMGLLQKVLNRQTAAQNVEEKTLTDLYEKGRANIIARNQGPSTSEQLFALSKALLAPRYHRGIAGTIGKISGAFGDIGEAERAARMAREEQLSKFDEVYGSKLAGLGTRRAQTAADLVRTAATLSKPKATSFSPRVTVGSDLKPRSRFGSEILTPPVEAVYQLQEYVANPANSDANKKIARENFDKKFGFGASEIYLEGQ